MRLSVFIRENNDLIIKEWEDFARTCPPAPEMDWKELRNNISGLLRFIVADLERPQSGDEQDQRAKGHCKPGLGEETEAEEHAEQRFTKGFDTLEMMSEFRALRATVMKLWVPQAGNEENALEDLRRFNEAIDQLVMESLERYMEKEQKARSLFAGTLVHDVKNPLNAIMQSAQLLHMLNSPDTRQRLMSDQILRSGKRINDLISQLIDTVRLRLGKQLPITREPADMRDIARSVVDELQVANPGKRISLNTTGQVVGEWDRSRISQVISNLVGNALQHGDAAGEITVRIEQSEEEAILSVHNYGPRISSELLPNIFDPLTRGVAASDDTNNMSMGLGLFISRQIALAHGGSISITSDEEKGTTFVVRFPRFATYSAVDWNGNTAHSPGHSPFQSQ